jgi:hypothetical protein
MPANYAQGDIRLLLPLKSGDCVRVLGDAPILNRALLTEDVDLHVVVDKSPSQKHTDLITYYEGVDSKLPFGDASSDHVIIPRLSPALMRDYPHNIKQILKPGGWLFVGFQNAQRLQQLRFWKKKGHHQSLVMSNCLKQLQQLDFQIVACYGIHNNLEHPQYWIPLENPAITNFYFTYIDIPYSRGAQMIRPFIYALTLANRHSILFNDIAIIAHRPIKESINL